MKEFNSKEYAWVNLAVYLFGRLVGGIRGCEDQKGVAKEALYGAGKYARSIQHGKVSVEGTLTLLQSELIALDNSAKAAGYSGIMDIEFDIVVSYVSDTGVVTSDRVVQASIKEVPKSLKEGDLFMEVALPFIAIDVEENLV
jgi:hypothetical protein